MNEQIEVAHTEDHEIINCPHCDESLCGYYPAEGDTGEVCLTTYYATGFKHTCEEGRDADS